MLRRCSIILFMLLFLTGCGQDVQPDNVIIPAQTNPDIDIDDAPEFNSLTALRDYLNENRLNDVLEFAFRYTGSDELTGQHLAQMTATCYISYYTVDDTYCVTLMTYSGDRIADAYKSGDSSGLSADEKLAMEMAVTMVEEAKTITQDQWELELLLHDMLCQKITYLDADSQVNDPNNLPRHLTVVGALVDGKANCQGYADAFYTVATIAGFTVDRMSVESPDDLHMVNTVLLDDQWYIVDVTYDDNDTTGVPNYRLFNAGLDMVSEYTWPPENEVHTLAQVSSQQYYYHHKGIYYESLEDMAESMVKQWTENGETLFETMLINEPDGDKLYDVLYEALLKTERSFGYSYEYFTNDRDTFYTVTITE